MPSPFAMLAAQILSNTTGRPSADWLEKGLCPLCGKKPDPNEFRDKESRDEFALSGVCQTCQDITFKEDP